jgi:hypothetical protein
MGLDRVVGAAADARTRDIAGSREPDDDSVHGTLGDPNAIADLAQPDARVLGNAEQHSRVGGQKRPCSGFISSHIYLGYRF